VEVLLDVDGEVVGYYTDSDTRVASILWTPSEGLWSEIDGGFAARNGPRAR